MTMIPDRDNEFFNIQRAGFLYRNATELTIASGVITVVQGNHTIDTEGDAASDDLDTINGAPEGMLVYVRPASGARTVVLKHDVGNIICPGAVDISLADVTDEALLFYNGSKWIVVAASLLAFASAQAGTATAATAPAFTGTAPTTAVTAAGLVTGTGLTAAGQVVTTTDSKTATLNQYAGCWLLAAAAPPALIISHPAAVAAPLVLTVMGLASTDAGAYRILAAPTPAGSVASHTHAQV